MVEPIFLIFPLSAFLGEASHTKDEPESVEKSLKEGSE